jgi:hypothetical protein
LSRLLAAVAALICVVAAARADVLYISFADSDNYVEKFSSSGTSGVNTDLGPLPSTTSCTNSPNGVAFDKFGCLYVTNDGDNTITKFSPTGASLGVYASGLNQPAAIAFDSNNNLFVVNNGNSSIVEITPAGVSSVFVSSGLGNPEGLAFGPNGNLYVSDQNSNSIKEITPSGQMSTFYQDGSYTIIHQVEGLAFDAAGNLYVASYRTNSIVEISPSGVPITFAGNPSPASDPNDPNNPSNPQGIFNPIGIAFDGSGDLFVANYHHTQVAGEPYDGYGISYIDEYSSRGTLLNSFAGNPALPGSDPNLRQASYIAIEPAAAQADALDVLTAPAFIPSGTIGGPFAPAAESYTVSNTGSSSLIWSAGATQSWLSLSATGGTLAASGSLSVTASINSNANALSPGTYADTVTFTDLATGFTQAEPVTLTVLAPAATPAITSPLSASIQLGPEYTYQITASNNPASYGASGLPLGLTLNSATGLISGTIQNIGETNVIISASNSAGIGTADVLFTVFPPSTWGFQPQAPPNAVTVTSLHRNNVFYVGDMLQFRLSNPSAAVTYEIRDYWGNIVEQGPAAEFIYPQVSQPGWYKLYIRGAQYQDPWGWDVGASTFVIWRNDPNFPPLPPLNTWGGSGLDDGIIRGLAAIGPDRHEVDDTDVPDSIANTNYAIAVDNQYYTPFDPVRPRKLLCSFANGTTNLANVAQIVTALKGSVKYWEPRNEPNFTTSAADFVNNELIPFYNTIKSIDPTLKVLGPEIVTIGPPEQQWVQDFFAAGGANYIDGFSFHAYNNVNGDLWLTRQTTSYLDSILAPYPNLERWQTEQGYFSCLYGAYQPRLQGRWTMLQMMVFEQHGIPKEQNNLWYDKNGGFWSEPTWWENNDGTLNPGAALMRVWSEELFGTTFTSSFDFGTPGNKLYVGDLFQGPGKNVAAFITAGSPLETIQLTDTGDATVNVVSPFGVSRTLPVQGGQITLPISEVPTYVEFSGTLNVVPVNSGTDLALTPGATASASGPGLYPPDPTVPNSPSKIIDGILENWYWSQTPPTHPFMDDTPQFPAWVEVDLPSPQTINYVVIYAGVPWQLDGTLIDYDLQYYNNGQWTNLATVKEPVKTFQTYMSSNQTKVDSFFSDHWVFQHSFPPVTTQKIRIYARDATWGGGPTEFFAETGGFTGPHNICLREVEVYDNPNPANVTPNQPPVATGTSVTTTAETPVDVHVLNDAFDPDNGPEPLHIQCVGPASNGSVSIVCDHVRYTPGPGFSGTDAFTYTVSDGAATASATVNVTVNPVTCQYAPMSGLIGMVGQYYGNQDLTDPLFTRADGIVNFDWGYVGPAPSMSGAHYSVEWTGTVQAAYSENYTFYTLSSDGVRLWVNGQLLVDDWVDQGTTEQSWSIPMKAGQPYPIVMDYYEDSGSSTIALSWASASTPKEIIPQFPTVPPLETGGLSMVQGQYYGTTNFSNLMDTRIDSSINFNWSNAPPFPNMNQTNFSVRWTGQIIPQYSEPYTFYTTSDDGIMVWINSTEVINDWNSHASRVDSGTIPLVAGTPYNIVVLYYQLTGPAVAVLQWSSPSQQMQVIPELPEEAWREANFSAAQLADPTQSGPTGDADGDGMANRLKYAFDINPQTSAGSGAPVLSFYTEAGRNYMALTYRRNSAVTDLIYDVQVSTTLTPGSWVTTTTPEEVLGQDPSTGDLFIRRSIDITGLPEEFMRLNIW